MRASILAPIDYSDRIRYRRPPWLYRRMQWLAPLVTRAHLAPGYVVTLEVPGRRTGFVHRTALVEATHEGRRYLVALSGESEWVRNVRANDGYAVLGRQRRRGVHLVEIPVEERAPILRGYLLRAHRHVGAERVTREARHYFGVSADPSPEELAEVARYYPIFRVDPIHPAAA